MTARRGHRRARFARLAARRVRAAGDGPHLAAGEHPGTSCRERQRRRQLNEWIMAWVVHQLPRDPLQLFDANIFYPAKDTLAFSEPLIVPALLAAPASSGSADRRSSRQPGAAPRLRADRPGRLRPGLSVDADRPAALAAGSLFAFNTHTLTRIAHIQGIHAYGLPLALAAHRPADPSHGSMRRRPGDLDGDDGVHVRATSWCLRRVMIAIALLARIADWRHHPRAVVGVSFALS